MWFKQVSEIQHFTAIYQHIGGGPNLVVVRRFIIQNRMNTVFGPFFKVYQLMSTGTRSIGSSKVPTKPNQLDSQRPDHLRKQPRRPQPRSLFWRKEFSFSWGLKEKFMFLFVLFLRQFFSIDFQYLHNHGQFVQCYE